MYNLYTTPSRKKAKILWVSFVTYAHDIIREIGTFIDSADGPAIIIADTRTGVGMVSSSTRVAYNWNAKHKAHHEWLTLQGVCAVQRHARTLYQKHHHGSCGAVPTPAGNKTLKYLSLNSICAVNKSISRSPGGRVLTQAYHELPSLSSSLSIRSVCGAHKTRPTRPKDVAQKIRNCPKING